MSANAWAGADVMLDESSCPICLSEQCDGHDEREAHLESADGLLVDALADAVDVAAEGRAIAEAGIKYTVNGIIPAYGVLGMSVAYAKVGKTTFGQALGGSVASGRPFLDREVQQVRVLMIAA